MQHLGRLAPTVAIDQIVELGDAVFHGATDAVAEGDPAIHAAGGLLGEHLVDQRLVDLFEVFDPFLDRAVAHFDPIELNEACRISH